MISKQDNVDKLWQLEVVTDAQKAGIYLDSLEEECESISCFEDPEDESKMFIRAFAEFQWQINDLQGIVKNLDLGDSYSVEQIENIDWVSKTQEDFAPVTVGGFYVHPSWHEPKEGLINLSIDPQMAFGTGTHETTKGCLELLDKLGKKHEFNNVLDIGAGTAILAIAAYKIWSDAKVIAFDIDEITVPVALENARINNSVVEVFASDGFADGRLKQQAPYDLMIANILANPLVSLAQDIFDVSKEETVVILSGILENQEEEVVGVYAKLGFEPLYRVQNGTWPSVAMIRRS